MLLSERWSKGNSLMPPPRFSLSLAYSGRESMLLCTVAYSSPKTIKVSVPTSLPLAPWKPLSPVHATSKMIILETRSGRRR